MMTSGGLKSRLQALVGAATGWQTRAAEVLDAKRPSLLRYMAWDNAGESDRVPSVIWTKLAQLERGGRRDSEPDIEEMLIGFARGMVAIQENLDTVGHIRVPYPKPLQRSFNIAAALRAIQAPGSDRLPTDLAQLIECARTSVYQWAPMASSDRLEVFLSERLLDGTQITRECLDLAALQEEDDEKQFFALLMDKCRSLDGDSGQELYEAWRSTVIEVPVAESHSAIIGRPGLRRHLSLTLELIQLFYTAVSPAQAVDGRVAICPVTRTRMRRIGDRWVSETRDPDLRRRSDEAGPEWVTWTPQMVELQRPPRLFWCHPGRYEVELADAAASRGWKVERWPSFDAIDLLISKPKTGRRYAVDVKDYVSPSHLARAFKGFKDFRQHTRLIVVPDYVTEPHPNYVSLFKRLREENGAPEVEMETMSRFLARLEA
jgi:hypothetical protein